MPELHWFLELPLKLLPGTQMFQIGCKAHDRALLLLPHGPLIGSVLPILFLTQQTNPFPYCATLVTVRMVPEIGMSQWNLPCTLTWKGSPGSDGLGTWHKMTCSFRDKCTALGDSVLLLGRSHLTRDILSLLLLPYLFFLDTSWADSLVCEVVLYFYWHKQVWISSTTEVIFLQLILQMINYWAMEYISPLPSILCGREEKAILWHDALWWRHLYIWEGPKEPRESIE